MENVILMLYLVLIAAPISTILHEAGHLFGAKLVNADKITLRIGVGKPIFNRSKGNIKFIMHAVYFLGGMTESERDPPYRKNDKIWITILGPAVNAVSALISYFLLFIYPSKYLTLFFLFNVWMAAGNCLPFKWRGSQTDGYTILQLLREK